MARTLYTVPPNPTKLGRYEIVKHLADGGMAQVWIGRATGIAGFERHVVVKQINTDLARNPTFVEMFLDEARTAAALHHSNIVQVHDIGKQDDEYFFTMEYVHGKDLRMLLRECAKRKQKVPWEHVVAIMSGVASGLHHAHELRGPDRKLLGLVHRDVSPANILVGYDGTVKVVDFGIAKAALRTGEGTRGGTLKGKVSYMAPEQCLGKAIDRRSDVYSLGVVLFELSTVRRLFKSENDFLTMSSIVAGKIPDPTSVNPDIPPALSEIILKALALKPSDRYQTADDMRQALERFAETRGLQTSTTGLSAYMNAVFGSQPEPWLVDDSPELELTVDFDGNASGVAPANEEAAAELALPSQANPAVSSPIVRARRRATESPPISTADGSQSMVKPMPKTASPEGTRPGDGPKADGTKPDGRRKQVVTIPPVGRPVVAIPPKVVTIPAVAKPDAAKPVVTIPNKSASKPVPSITDAKPSPPRRPTPPPIPTKARTPAPGVPMSPRAATETVDEEWNLEPSAPTVAAPDDKAKSAPPTVTPLAQVAKDGGDTPGHEPGTVDKPPVAADKPAANKADKPVAADEPVAADKAADKPAAADKAEADKPAAADVDKSVGDKPADDSDKPVDIDVDDQPQAAVASAAPTPPIEQPASRKNRRLSIIAAAVGAVVIVVFAITRLGGGSSSDHATSPPAQHTATPTTTPTVHAPENPPASVGGDTTSADPSPAATTDTPSIAPDHTADHSPTDDSTDKAATDEAATTADKATTDEPPADESATTTGPDPAKAHRPANTHRKHRRRPKWDPDQLFLK